MRILTTAIASAVILAGCVGGTVESTTTSSVATSTTSTTEATTSTVATTTTTPESTTTVTEEFPVYFFFQGFPVEPGPYLAPVARSGSPEIDEAMRALVAGPTVAELEMGLSSPIPEGTTLLGVEVTNGIASVDLSSEFESGGGSLSVLGRVAQVVYTATWFDEVDAVEFLIDGERVEVLTGEGLIVDQPQTRSDYVDLIPAIFIDGPFWGSAVGPSFNISGLALAGSGEVRYVVVDADGLIIAEADLPATLGARVEFSDAVVLDTVPHPGQGSIIVFELDADGIQQHVVEYPLTIRE